MSCDTHKYGYALKGTSTLLVRNHKLLRYQFFSVGDWPGGLVLFTYCSGKSFWRIERSHLGCHGIDG